jgi:hypothetical protein
MWFMGERQTRFASASNIVTASEQQHQASRQVIHSNAHVGPGEAEPDIQLQRCEVGLSGVRWMQDKRAWFTDESLGALTTHQNSMLILPLDA